MCQASTHEAPTTPETQPTSATDNQPTGPATANKGKVGGHKETFLAMRAARVNPREVAPARKSECSSGGRCTPRARKNRKAGTRNPHTQNSPSFASHGLDPAVNSMLGIAMVMAENNRSFSRNSSRDGASAGLEHDGTRATHMRHCCSISRS
jgi:hypothetical protein